MIKNLIWLTLFPLLGCYQFTSSTEVPTEIVVAVEGRATNGQALALQEVALLDAKDSVLALDTTDEQGYFKFAAKNLYSQNQYQLRSAQGLHTVFLPKEKMAFHSIDPLSTAMMQVLGTRYNQVSRDSLWALWFGNRFVQTGFEIAKGQNRQQDSLFVLREAFLTALDIYGGQNLGQVLDAQSKNGSTLFDSQSFLSIFANTIRKKGVSVGLSAEQIQKSTGQSTKADWEAKLQGMP